MSDFKLMVQEICRDICELPDYNSPEDQPDAMLCTGDELECILERRVEPAISRLTADNERLRAGLKAMTTQPYYVTQARSYIRLIVHELDRADSAATADSRHQHLIEAAKLYQSLGGVFAEIVLPSAALNPELKGDKG